MLNSALLSSLAVSLVVAWPGGAPSGACSSLQPGHAHNNLTTRQQADPPVTLRAKLLKNRQVRVSLTIKKKREDVERFRGFLVMAEVEGERGHGYFIPNAPSRDVARTLDCPDLPAGCDAESGACQGTSNAFTHSSAADKQSVAAVWTPPSQLAGQVVFRATVVGENSKEFSSWWENITSNKVKI